MQNPPLLYFVMPCYNEEHGIEHSIRQVSQKLHELESAGLVAMGSAMLFADDGSSDQTWAMLEAAHQKAPARVKAIHLAANRGKEYALWAGVMEARLHADIIISMDADLQFDIDAVENFLQLHAEGYELVYGIKNNRGKEAFFKGIASRAFYRLMRILGAPIIKNHTDYTLMTRQVCDALSEYEESNLMFRGLAKSLGFKQCPCYFKVKDREAGESHFSAWSLLNLSFDAITSFSVAPLRLIGFIGIFVLMAGIMMASWTCFDVFRGNPPSGYATLICSLWLLGGLGMISMAVVGEYLGKMYMETKKRPRYYISQRLK